MVKGDSICLRPMDINDAELIVAWRNQQDVVGQFFAVRGPTLEEHLEWFTRYKERNDRQEFMIVVAETGQAIGTIGLSNIDRLSRKAEYGILIGSPEHRGKGYAREATELILAYGFNEIGLQKISLKVFSDNLTAIQLYEHAGFIREGLLHREFYKDGRFRDVVVMAAFSGSDSHAD